MSRRDALLRLHKSLMTRRTDLRNRLGGELEDLGKGTTVNATGDAADAAFDTGSEEVVTQLAELEARELSQIERAITRLKQGTYGLCEICQIKIPVARLNALPYSTTCIKCQREMELYPDHDWEERRSRNWENVSDSDGPEERINLNDIEIDYSNNR